MLKLILFFECVARDIYPSTLSNMCKLTFLPNATDVLLFYIRSKNKPKAWKVIMWHSCTLLLHSSCKHSNHNILCRHSFESNCLLCHNFPAFSGFRLLPCSNIFSLSVHHNRAMLNACISRLFLALLLLSDCCATLVERVVKISRYTERCLRFPVVWSLSCRLS